MSITYEEALATLEAMFGEPWSRETLDKVLRHEKGHMENTCDRILNYGSEKDPQILIERLQSGEPTGGPPANNISMDEELARQLATEEGGRASRRGNKSSGSKQKGRGTPTTLPDDFLRIPGYKGRSGSASGATAGGEMDDETLARMLQDELFSQELARNPDFAHLARGRPRASNSAAAPRLGGFGLPGMPGMPPAQRRAGGGGNQQEEGPKIIEKLSEMGDNARKRLQLLAAQFEQKINQHRNAQTSQTNFMRGGLAGTNDTAAERRGLLDDEEDTIEFEMRKNK